MSDPQPVPAILLPVATNPALTDTVLANISGVVSQTAFANFPLASIFGTKSVNTFYAGPASGAAALPTFRSLVTADLAGVNLTQLSGVTYPIAPYIIGDILFANTATSMARLADVAVGSILASGGIGVAPRWSSSPTIGTSLNVGTNVALPSDTAFAVNKNAAALPVISFAGETWMARIAGVDGTAPVLSVEAFGSFAGIALQRANGTGVSPSAVQAGELIGALTAHAYGTNGYFGGAGQLRFTTKQTWTDTAQGTYASIWTTPNNTLSSTSTAEVIRFEDNAGVTIPPTVAGGSKGAGTLNATNLYIAGIPAIAATIVNSALLTTGSGGGITFTPTPALVSTANSDQFFTFQNASTGTGGSGGFDVLNSANNTYFGMASTGYTTVSILQNRGFIHVSSGASGITINNAGANPIVFGTSNIEQARILLGLMVGTSTDPGAGIINVLTGYRIGNAAASGNVLRGNGTNFVSTQLSVTDLTSIAALSILGNSSNASAAPASFSGTANQVPIINSGGSALAFTTVSGDLTNATGVFTISANVVGNTKIRQGAGLSVIGVTGGATANVSDIVGTANQFFGVNSAGTALAFQTMAGDATLSGPTITLATVATAGTVGSSTAIPVVTINAKGLTTSITTAAVIAPAGTLTGPTLAAGITASSLTSLGTIASLTATTINAFTLGGTISGGGNQVNNVVIGTSTPLAGSFTTVTGSTSVTSPVVAGGSGAASTLTLESTSGTGTTDSIIFQTGSQLFAGKIDTSQRWVIGPNNITPGSGVPLTATRNSAASASGNGNIVTQVIGADTSIATILLDGYHTTGPFIVTRQGRGTGASSTATQNNDVLGFFGMVGTSAANTFVNNLGGAGGVYFGAKAGENWSSTNQGARLELYTTPTGTNVIALAVTVQSSGGLSIGTATDPGIGSLQLNAQIFLPNITTSSAAQTGTVCWTTGTGKFTVDTTVGCLTSIEDAKNIVSPLDPSEALSLVRKLLPFSFRYKQGFGDSGQYEQFGLGAGHTATVDERMIGRDSDGMLRGVRYMELTAVLVAAIQGLEISNDNLRKQLERRAA